MERRFTVEAKTFSFSAKEGNSVIRLKEKRKGFGGFIFLGIKCSDWLTDTVEEALEAQKKEEFARSFRDEVRVLKVRMGSNKAGCFLEVAVFVEGGRKGVIRILEGRGGWGWQRFVDELRTLLAHLVEKVSPAVVIAGEVDSSPSFVEVVTPPGGVKPPLMEAQAPVTDLGSRLRPLRTSSDCSSEVLRRLAMDFLAKVRAEVDRILFFGLGLKIGPSRDIRRRMGRLFSQLGLKPKLLFGFKQRGRCKSRGLSLRPRSSAVVSRIRSNAGVDWVPVSDAGQGVASSEMVPVVSAVEYSDTVISGDDAFRGSVADSEEEISVARQAPLRRRLCFGVGLSGLSLHCRLQGRFLQGRRWGLLSRVLGSPTHRRWGMLFQARLCWRRIRIWNRFRAVVFLMSRGRTVCVFSLICFRIRFLVRRGLTSTRLWRMV
jgi:hypothetical protein